MRTHEMRRYIEQELSQLKGWRWQSNVIPHEKIDSLLYCMLPMISASKIPEKLHELFTALPGFSLSRVKRLVELYTQGIPGGIQGEAQEERGNNVMAADELQALALALLSLEKG